MAASLMSTARFVSPQSDCFRQPQAPPSPPMEDSRCSLPPISNLLGLVDAGTPTIEPSAASLTESRPEGLRAPWFRQHGGGRTLTRSRSCWLDFTPRPPGDAPRR